MNAVVNTFTRRAQGERPGRAKAVVAATATGIGVAAAVYRVLRSRIGTRDAKNEKKGRWRRNG